MSDAETLREAAEEYERVRDRVEREGIEDLRRVRGVYANLTDVLERYEDDATGYGDFESYVEFQERVADVVDGLPDDMPEREAFEAADDALQQRRLSAEDFEAAREALAPARELAELHAEYEEVRERYRSVYGDARERRRELDEAIDARWEVLALGEADLDAPVGDLREPVERYNEAVAADFDDMLGEAPARDAFEVIEAADSYPLVDVRQPPSRLAEYVEDAEVGTEPVKTLREYLDYSAEKLGHYVDDPGAFNRNVGTCRTYLRELDASPLAVDWPPPPASKLQWATRERLSLVARFADEDTVAALREVRALTDDPERYGRLREAAYAREHLSDDQRRRLREGEVREELAELRREREELADALARFPTP